MEDKDIERITQIIKERRKKQEVIAKEYFASLQQTPVLTGTNRSDRFVIDQQTGQRVFDRKYSWKKTKEIWLYGLEGDGRFEVSGKANMEVPVFLIVGKRKNSYRMESGHHIRVYEYESGKAALDTVPHVKKVFSDIPEIHQYDYNKIKHHKMSFTPWGIYDSDKGFSLGIFFTYAMYGFKRLPLTYQHRIRYDYIQDFVYQGIFFLLMMGRNRLI